MSEWPRCICCDELVLDLETAAHASCTQTIIDERDHFQNLVKVERERILALVEEELQGWRECAGMGNTFAIESTLVRLKRQINKPEE